MRRVRLPDGRWTTKYLHREIMERLGHDLTGRVVDHINGDGLNNLPRNLRVVTQAQNVANRHGPQRNNTSGYIGVTFDKQTGRWRAQVQVNGKNHNIGRFDTPEQAAKARDAYIRNRGFAFHRRAA
jgi:AP2 domain/HNH endonuclease